MTLPAAAVLMLAAAAAPTLEEAVVTNALGDRFRPIPAGTFVRGAPAGETGRRPNEGPAREVVLSRPYLLGETEVTVGQFRRFVEATGHVTEAERDVAGGFAIDWETGRVLQATGACWHAPGFPESFVLRDDHPVVMVSWQDAEAYCRWLTETDGRVHRLPTEAEWERAARGGTSTRWSFGDDSVGLRTHGNVGDAALRSAVPAMTAVADWNDGHPFLAPVGSFAPNPWGLLDVHGNAWEWCRDVHEDDFYARAPRVDPVATGAPGADLGFHAIRGGGWLDPPSRTRVAQRIHFAPTFRYCLLSGFRVLLEDPNAARTALLIRQEAEAPSDP